MEKRSHKKLIDNIEKKTLEKGSCKDDREDINIMEDRKEISSNSFSSDRDDEEF